MKNEKSSNELDITNIIYDSEFGITQEYNKDNRNKLLDSTKGKSEYKEKATICSAKALRNPIFL